MAKRRANYIYGKSQAPRTWHETADILKASNKMTKKYNDFGDRLEKIESHIRVGVKSHD